MESRANRALLEGSSQKFENINRQPYYTLTAADREDLCQPKIKLLRIYRERGERAAKRCRVELNA